MTFDRGTACWMPWHGGTLLRPPLTIGNTHIPPRVISIDGLSASMSDRPMMKSKALVLILILSTMAALVAPASSVSAQNATSSGYMTPSRPGQGLILSMET